MKYEAGVRDRGRGITDTVMAGFISMGAEHDRCLRSCRPWGMALVLLVVAACGGGGGGSGSSNDTDDTATVESVSLDRETLLLETEDSASITATLHLSNGGTASRSSNVNWSLGNSGVADIAGGDGTVVDVEGLSPGQTTITAESGGHSATADIYVSKNVALQVRPSAVHLPPKCSGQVTARLITDEGVTQDVTRDVNWSLSNSDLFTVKRGTADAGLISSLDDPGVSILGAVYRDKRATSRVKVEELDKLALFDAHEDDADITNDEIFLAQDEPRRLSAKGVFPSDMGLPKRTITNCVDWNSEKPSIATVNSDGIVNGVLPGGPVSVEAVADYDKDKFAEVDVNVTDNRMTGLSIEREDISIKEGQVDHLTANADFDDDSESQDITAVVDWSSDSPGIASVGNKTDTKGRVRGLTVGTTTARAVLAGVGDAANVTVSSGDGEPKSISVRATPNVILSEPNDSARICAQLVPNLPGTQMEDFDIDFSIVEDANATLSADSQYTNDKGEACVNLNGTAEETVTVRAEEDESGLSENVTVGVVSSFASVFDTSTIRETTNKFFQAIIVNGSNRQFKVDVDRFNFCVDGVDPDFDVSYPPEPDVDGGGSISVSVDTVAEHDSAEMAIVLTEESVDETFTIRHQFGNYNGAECQP